MCATTWVHFRISDAYIPEPTQILMELHGADLLEGRIIDVTEGGGPEGSYAVVEVEGLSQAVVIAMKKLKKVSSE
jgi:hypothetical protein